VNYNYACTSVGTDHTLGFMVDLFDDRMHGDAAIIATHYFIEKGLIPENGEIVIIAECNGVIRRFQCRSRRAEIIVDAKELP
jgi:hypothetical protein